MSQSVTQQQQDGLTSEWLSATFPLEVRKEQGQFTPTGWNVGSRMDGSIVTAMRVIETGNGEFMAEFAQGDRGLDEVRYSGGVGIPLVSTEHLDQLVAAMRLNYSR